MTRCLCDTPLYFLSFFNINARVVLINIHKKFILASTDLQFMIKKTKHLMKDA